MRGTFFATLALLSSAALSSPLPPPPNGGNVTIVPNTLPVPSTKPSDGTTAPHNASGAAVVNPGLHNNKFTHIQNDPGKVCMAFTSDNPNWMWRHDGPWQGTNTFGPGVRQICVPRDNNAGGAMFIGTEAGTYPGTTKLECYFPTSGTANCDISLVDGYSLSVACSTSSGVTFGGGQNLWQGGSCTDQSMAWAGICKNDQGYAPSQDNVEGFFQNARNNGNKYCVWQNCAEDYFFDVNESISCHVSGGR